MTGHAGAHAADPRGGSSDNPLDARVRRGLVRLKATTTSELDRLPHFPVPEGVSPLDLLLADRGGEELNCSTTAATEAIERLEQIGVVSQVSLGRRNRVYLNRAVLRLLDDFERDLLTDVDGKPGRLRTSARAKTAIPPALLPSADHAVLEGFPVGTGAPTAGAVAQLAGYRPEQIRPVLDRLATEGLVERVEAHGWALTPKGRQVRAMLRRSEDLRDI
jgi:ribosomal protein S19E (S16A)